MSGSSAPYLVSVTGSSVVLNGVDFSTSTSHGNATLFITSCTGCSVTNSNFGPGTTGYGSNNYIINTDSGSPNFTFNNNIVDGGSLVASPSSEPVPIISSGGGTTTLEYNWFKNSAQQALSEGTPASGSSLIDKYNFFDTVNVYPGNHMNYLQWVGAGGTITNPVVAYNTSYQTSLGGAEGYQWGWAGGGGSPTFTEVNPLLANNVEIALPNGGANTMSYINHGPAGANTDVSGGVAENNYIDPTGTISGTSVGAFYPGSFQAYSSGLYSGSTWSFSNNWNMATGVALSNTPP
jgi:hypothetical protein